MCEYLSVEFGVQVWDEGLRETGNTPQAMTRVTQAAERLGFDHVWINDHVITPVSQEKSYYPIGGAPWPLPPDADVHDPLAVLAMLGAVTERIRIGTSTLVVPLRAPLPTIKSLITIDHISAGRLTLGFAPGWWREEFEILGLPWEARGKVIDEYLDVFSLACGGGIHDYHGQHVSFDSVPFFPPSVQQPRIRDGELRHEHAGPAPRQPLRRRVPHPDAGRGGAGHRRPDAGRGRARSAVIPKASSSTTSRPS